jgi:hypothetical protein
MDSSNPQALVVWIILVLCLIAVAWLAMRRQRARQSQHLQDRFGPEYRRVVATHGDRAKAESELRAREKRVERLNIVPLSPADAAHFSQAWDALQRRFVDNPRGVVGEADRLVRELMVKRGYPMGDFERRAADISVDHPALVNSYRAAQVIAANDQRGEASTEELRKAIVYYRGLFDELLEVREPVPRSREARPGEVHS